MQEPAGGFSVAPISGVSLRTVARRLREADKVQAAEFRRNLRAAAAPMVPAVRAAIAALPSKQEGPRAGELRAAMSKATKLYIRTSGRLTGVVVMVDGSKMPSGQRSLPAYEEGTKPRWRHPTFGHDPWKDQVPHPYFYRTVAPYGEAARVAIAKAMHTTEEWIAGRRII